MKETAVTKKETLGTKIYKHYKKGTLVYKEEEHCAKVIDILAKKQRVSAFCAEVMIGEQTFYTWIQKYPLFKACYDMGQMLARENWEKEEEDNIDNPDWNQKAWQNRGSRYYALDLKKVRLDVDFTASPWEQYKQIIKQAGVGAFSAHEIKHLMDGINVGNRVHETFKMQEEVDKMKAELSEMSQRHGNNIIPISDAKASN